LGVGHVLENRERENRAKNRLDKGQMVSISLHNRNIWETFGCDLCFFKQFPERSTPTTSPTLS
jgi:uncharacterized protein YjhX (UPF0386 family)